MNITFRTLTCAAALAAFAPAFAQDEEETTEAAEASEAAEGASAEEGAAKHISEIDERPYTTLPFCFRSEGRSAEAKAPGSTEWTRVEEGRFYPLGTSFRTTGDDSHFELKFGREPMVVVKGQAAFSTRPQTLGVKDRAIFLESGTIELKLPLNFPEKLMTVCAKGFTVENPAGVSRYTYRSTGDGEEAVVRCVSGMLSIKGRHFAIPTMRAANEVKIRTSQDLLFTALYGTSGDYVCQLDQGMVQYMDYDANELKTEAKNLDWKISPKTAVRIFRKVPEVGKNLAVSVMTFDANGELRNRCTFTEGRFEVNTGDQGPATLKDRENAAKALKEAAEAATTTTEESAEEAPEAESSSEDASAAAADDTEF